MSDNKTETSEAKALFQMVRDAYGDRLDADELDEVRKGVDAIAEAAQALRAVKLQNGDEPLFIFTPYVGEGQADDV